MNREIKRIRAGLPTKIGRRRSRKSTGEATRRRSIMPRFRVFLVRIVPIYYKKRAKPSFRPRLFTRAAPRYSQPKVAGGLLVTS